MAKIIPVDTGVVVLAVGHNPTLLHPSFLTSEGIIESGWEVAQPPVSTPVVSVVKFKNGIEFMVEQRKFQVIDRADYSRIGQSRVQDYAEGYVRKLPHVQYTAVGVNFTALVECPNAHQVVQAAFLKEGPWTTGTHSLKQAGVKLTYGLSDGVRLTVTVDAGQITMLTGSQQVRHGVTVHGNYHRDLTDRSAESTANAIHATPQWATDFAEMAALIDAGLFQSK